MEVSNAFRLYYYVECVSKIISIISITFYAMHFALHLIVVIKKEEWLISKCLKLDHEILFLAMFL